MVIRILLMMAMMSIAVRMMRIMIVMMMVAIVVVEGDDAILTRCYTCLGGGDYSD